MRIDIVTLFPGMVEPVLGASMLGRARARGLVDIRVLDLRDYAKGKHRITDDYQFGGGGGMVLKPEPLFAAVEALRTRNHIQRLHARKQRLRLEHHAFTTAERPVIHGAMLVGGEVAQIVH